MIEYHTLWTIQPEEIGKQLEKGIPFICEKEKSSFYQDYNFQNAYHWMINQMNLKNIENPKKIDFPIWAWYKYDGKRKKPDLRKNDYEERGKHCVLIELKIPKKDVLLSDFDLWHHVLNHFPIFSIDETLNEVEFNKEFDKQYANYENLSKKKREQYLFHSWQSIFDITNATYIQGVFWELKIEYIQNMQYFIAK